MEITKKEAKELMNLPGEARGVVFKTDADFVEKRKGKKAVSEVEKEIKKLGFSLKYEDIESTDFYPLGLRILSFLAVKKVLGLEEEDLIEMGKEAPKSSLIIKMFFRFFFSLEKTLNQASVMWKKHYTVGELEAEGSEEEKEIVIKVKDFNIHPLLCLYYQGYFSTVVEMIINREADCERTACPFRNKKDKSHVYRFTW